MSFQLKVCTKANCNCSNLHVNKPRYPNSPCKKGAKCINANCFFAHPLEREQPKLIYVLCKYGAQCRRASCSFLHPEQNDQREFVKRYDEKKCKWRSNCPEKDGECKLDGHNEEPPRCRFGAACRNKDREQNPCLWAHEQKQALCPKGEDCNRGSKCWYAFHNVAEVMVLQGKLAKLNPFPPAVSN